MALPAEGTAWPPKPYDKIAEDMNIWGAWYDGDQEALEQVYAQSVRVRPSQFKAGLVGAVARFFWGRPNPQGTKRVHVPAAADLARASSDLLFSERPTFTFPPPPADADETEGEAEEADTWRKEAQARLDLLFNNDETGAMLAESGELASAFGGVFFRLWWDGTVGERIMLSCHPADAAIPEWRYDQLAAVTFWRELEAPDGIESSAVIRHLERHERGRIEHGLYKGTESNLGVPMPLDAHPETAWAAEESNGDGVIHTGVDGLTAAYVPNVRPSRKWRKEPGLANLGRSDFDGVEGLFDALDETMTSWMRDVDLGKARLMVAEDGLTNNGPGRGGSWDTDQEIFTKVPTSGMGAMNSSNGGGHLVEQAQFAIRWQEHSQTVAEILNAILRNAGLSSAEFSDQNLTVGVATATEINARERMSERTRNKKMGYYRAALSPLVSVAMHLDNEIFDGGANFEEEPVMSFPIRSTQSPQEQTTVMSQRKQAHLVSIHQAITELRPNWNEHQVKEEIERIHADQLREMKIAYGKFGEGEGETPLEDTEGQPDDGDGGEGDDGDVMAPADDMDDLDDPQIEQLAEQLADDAEAGEA